MRGSPLFRTGLVLLALLLLLPVLLGLTNRRPAPIVTAASPPPVTSLLRLTITATNVPFHFTVSHLGKIIWSDESAEQSSTKIVALNFPRAGVDLLVEASWTQKNLGAVRLDVTPAGRAPLTQTLWGNGSVNDVLTFAPAP